MVPASDRGSGVDPRASRTSNWRRSPLRYGAGQGCQARPPGQPPDSASGCPTGEAAVSPVATRRRRPGSTSIPRSWSSSIRSPIAQACRPSRAIGISSGRLGVARPPREAGAGPQEGAGGVEEEPDQVSQFDGLGQLEGRQLRSRRTEARAPSGRIARRARFGRSDRAPTGRLPESLRPGQSGPVEAERTLLLSARGQPRGRNSADRTAATDVGAGSAPGPAHRWPPARSGRARPAVHRPAPTVASPRWFADRLPHR